MKGLKGLAFRMRGFTPVPFIFVSLWWAETNTYLILSGAIITIFGELIRFQSIRYAGGATRTREVGADALVTTGPYAMMRNPLYFANMLIYIGYAIGSGSLSPYLPLVALVFFSIQYYLIISLEEITLSKLFGDSYAEYCNNVPRLFPKLTLSIQGKQPSYPVSEAFRQERSTLAGIFITWAILFIRMYAL